LSPEDVESADVPWEAKTNNNDNTVKTNGTVDTPAPAKVGKTDDISKAFDDLFS